MANLIAELTFIVSVIDWGNIRGVVEYYYWRAFK